MIGIFKLPGPVAEAEAWTGYGNDFLGCLAKTAPAEAYPMENDVLQEGRRDASGGSLQKRSGHEFP